jgi:hypothetical protein
MSEFERRITEARRASLEIASQVQRMIDEARDRRGDPVAAAVDGGGDEQDDTGP